MRELLVAQQLRNRVPGGIGAYVRGLIAGFSDLERPTTLWLSRTGGPDPLERLDVELVTSRLPAKLLTRAWDAGFVRPPKSFDVLHATSLLTPPSRMPMTVMVHDLAWRAYPETFTSRGRRWHEAALARATKRATKFIVPSTQTANDLIDYGITTDRIEVIAHGHDHLPEPNHELVDRKLEGLGIGRNQQFLLAVGTLEPRKNLHRLLAAYSRIRDELPEQWPLVVVGPQGWGPQLEAVEGAVIISDASLAQIAALYERCRMFAYVPLLEGFGLPVIEAMSKGAPVLTTSVPSAGGSALQVDPNNVAAIADGLLRVATDDGLRADLRRKGLAHAQSSTWKSSAIAHLRLWESL